MGIQVEFEVAGRTYRVEPNVLEWNIHAVNLIRNKVVLTTDLLTGEKIFVDWGSIPLLRLVEPE